MKARFALSGLALLATAGFATSAAAQYCPSYTASSASNDQGCAVEAVPGTNPTPDEWAAIFDLVSRGPSEWGTAGPDVDDIGQGCGLVEPLHDVPARFPCELLKAIAMVESGWQQFCEPTTPADQVGKSSRTIISFDCGYGIGQVTSGMHVGETPSFDRERVASDATYNLATGTRILAAKWRATECVGDNQPTVVEHWYTATWAYNGLAYVNNPNNPNYDVERGVYNPAVGNAAPYQEKVFGRVEYPTNGLWDSVALAYPNPGDCGTTGAPPSLPEPDCASPTDCNNKRSTHVTSCIDDPGSGGSSDGGSGGMNGSGGTVSNAGATSTTTGLDTGGASSGGAGNDGDGPSEDGCNCAFERSNQTSSSGVLFGLFGMFSIIALASRRPRGIQ